MNLGRLGKREILDMIDKTKPERPVSMLFLESDHAIASTTGDHLDEKVQVFHSTIASGMITLWGR